jgi:iron complex transport system substrate-binding protein
MFKKLKISLILCLVAYPWAGINAQTRVIIDMKGRAVTIPSEVKRIAANGALAQMVIMLGGSDRIVSTGLFLKENPMLLKIWPGISGVPSSFSIPGSKSEINIEELLKTNPEIVLGDNPKVESTGIPCLAVSLLNFEDIKKTVLLIGNALGADAEKKAVEFCGYYDSTIKAIMHKTAKLTSAQQPLVYYGGGNQCLSTEGKNAIASSWINAAGGKNLSEAAGIAGSHDIPMEEIIKYDPEIIIVSSVNCKQEIISSPAWKNITAVCRKKVFSVPKGVYLWSVRSAEGALQIPWAATIIHPELFQDLNINDCIRSFYHRFYNYKLTDAEIKSILNPVK